MSDAVVDASVVGIAIFNEPHADGAVKLLASGGVLFVPDLIYAEVGNIIWKRHTRGEIDAADAAELHTDLLRLPLTPTPCRDLSATAVQLALQTKRTAYDCMYLALAMARNVRVVTGDKRLVNSLQHGPLARHVVWIGEWE